MLYSPYTETYTSGSSMYMTDVNSTSQGLGQMSIIGSYSSSRRGSAFIFPWLANIYIITSIALNIDTDQFLMCFFLDHLWVLFPDVVMVIASEVAVDVVKHAFITKFNDISADVSAHTTVLHSLLSQFIHDVVVLWVLLVVLKTNLKKCNSMSTIFSCFKSHLKLFIM